jgi:phosphonate transport system permease protein
MDTRRPIPPPVIAPATLALLVGLLALVAASFYSLNIKWAELFTTSAVRSSMEFLQGFAPPEMATPFLIRVAEGTLETLS